MARHYTDTKHGAPFSFPFNGLENVGGNTPNHLTQKEILWIDRLSITVPTGFNELNELMSFIKLHV